MSKLKDQMTLRQEAIDTFIGNARAVSCEFDGSNVERKASRDRVTKALIDLGVKLHEIKSTENWQEFC